MPDVQPPEGLRKIAFEAVDNATDAIAGAEVWRVADAVLAALFEACTVREQPHMWLHGGIRTERSLILSYRLPDEPIPELGPDVAAALARARARVSSTGEEPTDGAG